MYLEREYNWTGLLVEADPAVLPVLKARNRHAWVADVCLSPVKEPVPSKLTMYGAKNVIAHGYIPNDVIANERTNKMTYSRQFEVDCYPLETLLDAVGVTTVDYLSLDVEGVELDILKTIPWEKFRINIISVEVRPGGKSSTGIKNYLEPLGYKKIKEITVGADYIHDHVYELINKDEEK